LKPNYYRVLKTKLPYGRNIERPDPEHICRTRIAWNA